jgi:hypothetical protein
MGINVVMESFFYSKPQLLPWNPLKRFDERYIYSGYNEPLFLWILLEQVPM